MPANTAALPLHVVDTTMFWSAAGGGVRRYLLAKHAWMEGRADVRHTVVAPGAHGPGFVDCGGLPLPRSGGYRVPVGRASLARLLAAQTPDVIEAGDPYVPGWATLDAARRCGVPAVAFCHSNLVAMAARWSGDAGWARRAAAAYLRRLYGRFDLVLAPSRAATAELQALGIAHAEHQPLGVDTALFHPGLRDPAWRAGLGLPAEARVLLYVGRFALEKNLPLLVEAVQRLGAPWWLLAVGAGPKPPTGERVRVLPFEADTRALARTLASADLFVHAGDQETFGLAALEAMACGTPVVVRARAGLAELAAGGVGTAVDSDRPGAWAEALAAAFEADRGVQAAAARQRAEAHAWPAVLAAQLQRYRRAIDTLKATR